MRHGTEGDADINTQGNNKERQNTRGTQLIQITKTRAKQEAQNFKVKQKTHVKTD